MRDVQSYTIISGLIQLEKTADNFIVHHISAYENICGSHFKIPTMVTMETNIALHNQGLVKLTGRQKIIPVQSVELCTFATNTML